MKMRELLQSQSAATLIKQFPLLTRCPNDMKVAARTVSRNARLLGQGESVDEVLFLLAGAVDIVHEAARFGMYVFAETRAPDVFGEMEVLAGHDRYFASIEAVTECRCLVFSAADYRCWLQKDNFYLLARAQVAVKLLLLQGEQERGAHFKDAGEALAQYLVYACRSGETTPEGVLIRESRESISTHTGFSVRTVNREITKLEARKLIRRKHGKILISQAQYEDLRQSR